MIAFGLGVSFGPTQNSMCSSLSYIVNYATSINKPRVIEMVYKDYLKPLRINLLSHLYTHVIYTFTGFLRKENESRLD